MQKKNIIVVFGGNSFEHDISIITAVMMIKNYNLGKYNLLPVYLSKDNKWFFYCGKDTLEVKYFKDFNKNHKSNGFVDAYFKTNSPYIYFKSGIFEKKIPIFAVLNCAHGGVGEDGTLNSFFSMLKLPVSCGDSAAMSVCMDKVLTKGFIDQIKIKTLPYVAINKNSDYIYELKNFIDKVGYPVIVKPARLGSSIGIKIAKDFQELNSSVEFAFEFDEKLLIEKAIIDDMKEYNVACMRCDDEIIVSDIDLATKSDEILSFKDKYIGNASCSHNSSKLKGGGCLLGKKDFPTVVLTKLKRKMQSISEQIYEKMQFLGPVRFDFIVDKKGTVYLNEINFIPGSLAYYFFIPSKFNSISSYIDKIIEVSVNDYETKSKIKREFLSTLI